jgi:hypothetical protein
MKFTNGQVHEVCQGLNSIAENERVIPQMAKFKLARMYDTLKPIVEPIERRRQALIQQYGSKKQNPQNPMQEVWGLWPTDETFPKYQEAWDAIGKEDAGEINIKPITMTMLGDDPKGVAMNEMIWLGPLVVDDSEGK